eukprot:1072449-Rhodomonas_salina.2
MLCYAVSGALPQVPPATSYAYYPTPHTAPATPHFYLPILLMLSSYAAPPTPSYAVSGTDGAYGMMLSYATLCPVHCQRLQLSSYM